MAAHGLAERISPGQHGPNGCVEASPTRSDVCCGVRITGRPWLFVLAFAGCSTDATDPAAPAPDAQAPGAQRAEPTDKNSKGPHARPKMPKVGDAAPALSLKTPTGTERSLNLLASAGPVVLMFGSYT